MSYHLFKCRVGEVGLASAPGLTSSFGGRTMRELHFDLLRLQKDNRQGSHGSRRARGHVLAQAAETLHQLGYRGLQAKGLKGPARRGAGGGVAPPGPHRRYSQESHGAPSLACKENRQAGDRAPSQRELRGRRAVRDLNRDLLQLRRRAGAGGSHATRRDRPANPRDRVRPRRGPRAGRRSRDTRLRRDRSQRPGNRRRRIPRAADPSENPASGAAGSRRSGSAGRERAGYPTPAPAA